MDRHGTKQGYDIPITRAVSEAVSISVIASGGAGNMVDMCLATGIFHFGEYTVSEAKEYLKKREIPVRT
jgi:cyclase